MKRTIVILSFTVLLTSNAFAAGQEPDQLIYKEKLEVIFSNPLESYFSHQHPRPNNVFSKKRCNAILRGYIATWEIRKKTLYLVKMVQGTCEKKPVVIPLNRLFARKKKKVKASWFSGKLRIQKGKQLKYMHQGYETIYEKEVILTIKKGQLVGKIIVDNSSKALLMRYKQEQKRIEQEQQSPALSYREYEEIYPYKAKEVIVDEEIYKNIYRISKATGHSVKAIITANPRIDINNLRVGQSIDLPKRN